jgi:flagellar hook-associated protein 1 FlgK
MSSFHGLELAKQALFTQQSALYTTGHNIANANTEGYSRQRVNFEAMDALPVASRNRMGNPGQIGTGVQAQSIERIRNEFLDGQFRSESSLAGYWENRAASLGRMEDVLNDLNETGLSSVMDQFWSSLQDLAVNPTNNGARSVVLQRGIALSETFNHLDHTLEAIQRDLQTEIDHAVRSVNNITTNIQELNEQIKSLEINGYTANDLYDKRDVLIDELSSILPIEVSYEDSRKSTMDEELPPNRDSAQEGVVLIEVFGETLVNGITGDREEVVITPPMNGEELDMVQSITIGDQEISIHEVVDNQRGSLSSLVEAYGYTDAEGNVRGDFYERRNEITDIRDAFISLFNTRHEQGFDLNGDQGTAFFGTDESGDMVVLIEDTELVAASSTGGDSRDGMNAFELSNVFEDANVRGDYASLIGTLAVELQDAQRMEENTSVLLTQLDSNRKSVSSVSLDEEMTNLIKFQHAYNAAARSMTATDELLDRIINNMGLVGR